MPWKAQGEEEAAPVTNVKDLGDREEIS